MQLQRYKLREVVYRNFCHRRYFSLESRQITPESYLDEELRTVLEKTEFTKHLNNLKPFPSDSSILNAQHFYQNEVLIGYLKQDAHPVSLRQLAGYGKTLTKQKILNSANFVRLELPIRLALRVRDLQTLPFGVVNNHHLAQIYESYYLLFNAFRKIPPVKSLDDNEKFCEIISSLLDEHYSNLSHLMMGALEISILGVLPQTQLDQFMSSMLRSRISRRVIVEEHLSLSELYKSSPYSKRPPDYIGEIFHDCNAAENFKIVADLVKTSMLGFYPNRKHMPDLEIEGDLNTSFPFMVPHLHYLFGEILRNSYEAVIKTHMKRTSRKLPPIKIAIIDSKKEVTFRISDQGGGLKHGSLSDIWSFGKTPNRARKSLANFHRIPGVDPQNSFKGSSSTASAASDDDLFSETSIAEINRQVKSVKLKKSTLSTLITRPYEYKLGLGLPMCKVYADYWNGSLVMNSLEGYGSDTCLSLSKLGYHSDVIQLDRA